MEFSSTLPPDAEDLISRMCPQCGLILRIGDYPFCKSGHVASNVQTVQDDVPGGFTVENMGPEPMHFRSKSEWRATMKAMGLVNMVRHVGSRGSDKSQHTQRFV